MAMDNEEIYARQALEAKRRDTAEKVARARGKLDASAALARFMSKVNQDEVVLKNQLEQELRDLEIMPGLTDDWGKYSKLEKAMFEERSFAKPLAYDWLMANPGATQIEAAEVMQQFMTEYRVSVGKDYLLQSPQGIVAEWRTQAFATGLIAENTWEAFRTFLLSIPREQAVGLDQ